MLHLAIFSFSCEAVMKNETVYKRFQAVANKRKDAPFLQVLRETALIYNINDGDTS